MRVLMYCGKCLRFEQHTRIHDGSCVYCGTKYVPTVRQEVEIKQKGVTRTKPSKDVQIDLLGFEALKKGRK